ncbi:hypothetical protein Purlil1_13132 [Purpureocillium lilacinum]|uniref:V-SNARE coiled-coil homology domain-containing protein n=1 Tax=Purpureocillium lilacinum TaxID=33203 RepID=A0ABR0BEY5_PURLI|nr:hypothetical protein Purlil1_13132 [Purpureocillium lilacinum]
MLSTQYGINLTQGIHNAVGVMHENMEKVSERGQGLNALQDRAENLATSSQYFRRSANRVRKQMWWKEVKMRICLAVGIATLLCIIIIPSVPYLDGIFANNTKKGGERRKTHGLPTAMLVEISEVAQFDHDGFTYCGILSQAVPGDVDPALPAP